MVAMDPRTGEILGAYSSPSFDPNLFVRGADADVWQQISTNEEHPLLNRAIQAIYPPASPWKLVVASMALRRGLVTPRTRMTMPCTGGMRYYTRYFRCWKVEGHGDVTLAEAIEHSCDVYFYQLGLKLTLDNLLRDGVGWGLDRPSGIDLPGESDPVFPASTAYFTERYGPQGWTNAVTLNLAIGQGENAQTVINMVRFYAMLAHPHGESRPPRLVVGGDTAGLAEDIRSLGLAPHDLMALREALVSVVASGTAVGARVEALRIAGKTGTAQNAHGEDHGWFVAFAPADDPQIVVGAVVEFAEHGSSVAPLVNQAIAHHLFGAEAGASEFELRLPDDSAPAAIPIQPVVSPRGDAEPGVARVDSSPR